MAQLSVGAHNYHNSTCQGEKKKPVKPIYV